MAKICAIYPRKSKKNDASESMETQIFMCTEYLKSRFPDCIIKIYDKDYSITGHSLKNRKDFQRMMNDIKSGIINIVAIQRYDRIARNTRDFCNLYYDMEQSGCELVSVSQRIDTSTPYGKKFMYDLASTAELEWALCSERHKDVNRYARLNRKCTLSPYALPFGIKAEVRDGKRVAVIDKEKEHIVRDAISFYMEAENKTKTTRYINSKYGLKLSHSFMERLIKSDFYHGSYREVPDYCEAYMTLEEHEKMRKISSKYVRHYSDDKNYFLFTGLLICPVCGLKMESQSQINTSGNRYYYYRCYNTYRTGKCTFKGNINERLIENYLLDFLKDEMTKFYTSVDKNTASPQKTSDIGKYKAEMERLNKLFLKGRIEESYYDTEYERLEKIIASFSSDEPQRKFSKEQIEELFADGWQEKYLSLSRENKRTFWKNIIHHINFNSDKTIKSLDFQ